MSLPNQPESYQDVNSSLSSNNMSSSCLPRAFSWTRRMGYAFGTGGPNSLQEHIKRPFKVRRQVIVYGESISSKGTRNASSCHGAMGKTDNQMHQIITYHHKKKVLEGDILAGKTHTSSCQPTVYSSLQLTNATL